MTLAEKMDHYHALVSKNQLKSTRQRDLIVKQFFSRHEHITVEELWHRVKKIENRVGYATVYRTLKLLTELGLASKREFGEASARYEQVTEEHHDHLICVSCEKIVEFEDSKIEKLQDKVCADYGFELLRHRLELYGRCPSCRKK